MCGLNYMTGDCLAIIDDDFQNPPEEILKLLEKLKEGYDVVYSYYAKKHHSFIRNLGSTFNDWVASKMLQKPKGLYLSSFKVMTAALVREIIMYQGPFPYIDGIILQSTTRIGTQLSKHAARKKGRSNYTLRKLILLWLNVFTGYSIMPLRVVSVAGLFMSGFSVVLGIYFIISYKVGGILFDQPVPVGWASLIIAVIFYAGFQLAVLGLIGEYLGRLFLTVNRRRQYIVRDVYEHEIGKSD